MGITKVSKEEFKQEIINISHFLADKYYVNPSSEDMALCGAIFLQGYNYAKGIQLEDYNSSDVKQV